MKELIKYLVARLDEASTWASLSVFLATMGLHIPAGLWQDVSLFGMAGAAGAGVLIREKGKLPLSITAKEVADAIINGLQNPQPAQPPVKL